MKNQNSISSGVNNEFYNSYKLENSPVLSYVENGVFDTPTPEPLVDVNKIARLHELTEVEHEAAVRVFGLGQSLKAKRQGKISQSQVQNG